MSHDPRESESPVENMLRRWAARKLGIGVAEVLSVSFTHEDGWTSDSGTGWPEENTAVVILASVAKGHPERPRKREFSVRGVDGIPSLLAEILSEADDDA